MQVVDGTLDLVFQMGQELVATKHVHEKLFALLEMHLHMQVLGYVILIHNLLYLDVTSCVKKSAITKE